VQFSALHRSLLRSSSSLFPLLYRVVFVFVLVVVTVVVVVAWLRRWRPASDECWVDEGGEDRRRRTPLMIAANLKRIRCLRALVDEFGANVNVQVWMCGGDTHPLTHPLTHSLTHSLAHSHYSHAHTQAGGKAAHMFSCSVPRDCAPPPPPPQADQSLYTALHDAVFVNFEEGVEFLASRGADPTLKNKCVQLLMQQLVRGSMHDDTLPPPCCRCRRWCETVRDSVGKMKGGGARMRALLDRVFP
jgi:hypothetical protein